jgi:SAM-dependent methyltransferase
MADAEHLRRARSFGAVADLYERSRPGYPVEAVRWVLELAPGPQVLDLAAGTGKLTRAAREAGAAVTAVEPLGEMRAQLARALPDVTAVAGTAEDIPLPDRSFDGVLVGQAFHWFDRDRALDEIVRVLRPGGVVGLLWNVRDDRAGWVADLMEVAPGGDTVSGFAAPEDELVHPALGPAERRSVPNPTPFDRERLLEWASSTSAVSTLPPAERDARLARIGELALTHPQLRGRETFDMPFVTITVRAARTGHVVPA